MARPLARPNNASMCAVTSETLSVAAVMCCARASNLCLMAKRTVDR